MPDYRSRQMLAERCESSRATKAVLFLARAPDFRQKKPRISRMPRMNQHDAADAWRVLRDRIVNRRSAIPFHAHDTFPGLETPATGSCRSAAEGCGAGSGTCVQRPLKIAASWAAE
jgi:hypothetical protein